ncbi:penicillin-binding protein [Virgibacillus kekensis]|uniref:serine-type D-Ala-D-Ala carboxypeptidase n=1 Tax=Virgibacillus kekensis TaxID=202261 RepID=A0ABV9DFB3_9BACI
MKKNKTTHFMSWVLILCFVGIFLLVAGRFLYIQATGEIDNVSLDKWAEEMRTASYTLEAERGKIYDTNGMTLAYNRPTYRVQAIVDESYTQNPEEPMHVKNPEKTAEVLAPLLDAEKRFLLERIKKGIEKDLFQVEFGKVGRELSQQTKKEIESLDLPGITFTEEAIRYYPNGMFASHILGFARKQEGQIVGQTGIEKEMNKLLGGEDGHISYERDNYNTELLNPNEVIKKPEDGEDVYLTIDQKIQTLLEDTMTEMFKKYNPERMTAIVMDPKTGEVVAMSNRPSYNPNVLDNVENWYNDAISTPFEPGSTMKMFTWAAAMEEGVYKGDEWFKSGKYRISEKMRPIHDWDGDWGSITYDEGFARSSNVAAAKLVWEKIGPEKFLDYLNAFDFDEKTGIDLPGEVVGEILYNWPIEKLTTSYGQGTTTTPIQLMKAATAIANDGKMMKPYVISKIVDSSTGDVIKKKSPEVVDTPISEETSKQMMDLLGSAVSAEYGTGDDYALEDYSVAGKTGTAQIPDPDNPGYMTGHENYIFSFLGMAPKDDPELMMYVSVKQPELEGYTPGSKPISFVFRNVMSKSLHYLSIDPDKESSKPVDSVTVPELLGQDVNAVKGSLTEKGINVTVIGNGTTVQKASVEKGEKLLPTDRVMLVTEKPVMPDITGWSMREVLELASLLDLKVETLGNGYAFSQSIKEGSPVKKNDYLGVEFTPPGVTPEQEPPPEEGQEQDPVSDDNTTEEDTETSEDSGSGSDTEEQT